MPSMPTIAVLHTKESAAMNVEETMAKYVVIVHHARFIEFHEPTVSTQARLVAVLYVGVTLNRHICGASRYGTFVLIRRAWPFRWCAAANFEP